MYSPVSVLSSYDAGVQDKIGQPLIYIVRHANVAADTKETIRGLTNPGLDDRGNKQAQDIVEFFADIDLSAIFTDDMKRAYQTALPLAASKNIDIVRDPALRSWDVGPELENKSIEDNEEKIAELRMQPDIVPEGGQSWASYQKQIEDALQRYIGIAIDEPSPIVIVIHGSGIQVIWSGLGELDDVTKYDEIPLQPSGIAILNLSRFGPRVKILEGEGKNLDE
jgi:broad specificity phosphatase PhoE